MNFIAILCLIFFMMSIKISGLVHSKSMAKDPIARYIRQDSEPDMGIPLDWLDESPIDQKNGKSEMPFPEGIPAETEEGSENDGKEEEGDDGPEGSKSEKKSKISTDELNPGLKEDYSKAESSIEIEEDNANSKIPQSKSGKELSKLVEICDKPVIISAANRFINSTVRLFRENSYWDLMGLPDETAFTSEKMTLSAPMAPVGPKTSIVTVLEGKLKGKTYKFQKQFFWSWDEEGNQVSGGKGGEFWDQLPEGGFDTMFHNGNSTKPMIIAFKEDLVYYLSTKDEELELLYSEGKIGGRFKENFPPGLTTAFTWSIGNAIKVYLFRAEKYCLRDVGTPSSGKDCDKWRENSELFGCQPKPAPTSATITTLSSDAAVNPSSTTTTSGSSSPSPKETSKGDASPATKPHPNPSSGYPPSAKAYVSLLVFTSIFLKYF